MTEEEKNTIFKEVMKKHSKKGGQATYKKHGKKHYQKMNKASQLSRYGKIKEEK